MPSFQKIIDLIAKWQTTFFDMFAESLALSFVIDTKSKLQSCCKPSIKNHFLQCFKTSRYGVKRKILNAPGLSWTVQDSKNSSDKEINFIYNIYPKQKNATNFKIKFFHVK